MRGVLPLFAGDSGHRRAVLAWLLSIGLTLFACSVQAAGDDIEIRSPYVTPMAGVYVLNAQLLFTVPEQVERTIREGATLTLDLQIKVTRTRKWWRDEVLAQLQQRYVLLYHGVSERYVLRNVNSGAQTSHASFAQAIESLQHIENLPVLDTDLLTTDARNEFSLRATMGVRSIPRALGLLLFWVDDFSLESDWYTWPLKP
ncbi:MAG: DUF4390 domain-containing protein [Steroidobacteraceae bacterium]